MAYVYKITNKKNGKMYIGKTKFSVKKRWGQHCRDYKKDRNEDRPLYRAMSKYGVELFEVEVIEKANHKKAEEREKFWIEYYGTFKDGYNATVGGDGKQYIDYDLVVSLYRKVQNQAKVARIMNISVSNVYDILKIKEVKVLSSAKVNKEKSSKAVAQIGEKGEILNVFSSLGDAGRFLGGVGKYAHISKVCSGKRKTAYGYKWEFI